MSESDIIMLTLQLVEEIAAERSGYCETEDEREWSEVFKMVHHARNPSCRPNHPDWGQAIEKPEAGDADGGDR